MLESPLEIGLSYDGCTSGQRIYAYVGGNPVSNKDPKGLAVPVAIAACAANPACAALVAVTVAATAKAIKDTIDALNRRPTEARGHSDPVTGQRPFDPGRDCDGKCNKCPPPIYWDAEGDAHGSTGGSHWHGIVWNQDPATCMCYPNRVSGSSPGNAR